MEEKMERYKVLFEKNVIKSEGCWGWNSFIDQKRSGRIGPRGHFLSASHASWLIHKGEIPKGLLVLHKCHNRICSNPDHLYIGTNKDNTQDMLRADRGVFCKQNSKLAKLDREKVLQIKELLRIKTLSQYEIAKKFKVSRGTILDIVHGRSWKDV
jgi:predicted XRE-type DNA-binding protein